MWAFFQINNEQVHFWIWTWSWGFSLNVAVVSNGNHGLVTDQQLGHCFFFRSLRFFGSMRTELFAAGLGEFHHHQRSLWRLRQRFWGRFPSSECGWAVCQPCPILAGDPDLSDFSVPLMDMGLDSLSAVEFRNRVQAMEWRDGFWRFFDELYLLDDLPDLSVPHQKGISFWA